MSAKVKNTPRPSFSNLDLGSERKERISLYCAKVQLDTHQRPTLNDAVCALVDFALDSKMIPTPDPVS